MINLLPEAVLEVSWEKNDFWIDWDVLGRLF